MEPLLKDYQNYQNYPVRIIKSSWEIGKEYNTSINYDRIKNVKSFIEEIKRCYRLRKMEKNNDKFLNKIVKNISIHINKEIERELVPIKGGGYIIKKSFMEKMINRFKKFLGVKYDK